ncbi:MAG: ATP-binding protein [Thermodesulfovibrionales bacterium]
MADIWARYLLAVPGTLLTAYALMLQSAEIRKLGLSRPIIYLKASAIGFLFYGFFSGLVVPDDSFFPAAVLNYTVFADATGLKVQVFRTFCAWVIAFGVIKVLSIFDWETIEEIRTSRDEIERKVKQRTRDLNETNAELEREIAERKKLQDLIGSAKKEWEESFDVINDAITIHDKDFNIIRANKSVTKMLGLSFREIIGQKCHQLYHGLDSPPEGCTSCIALKTGIPSTIEMFEPHLDKFLEIKAFPQVDENNQISKVVHVIRDITERKRMEDMLRDSERLLRESETVARLGSYALDVKSGKWRSSQVLDEIFGIGKEYRRDVEGWAFLVHPDFRSQMVKYFSTEVIKEKQHFDMEYKIVRQTDQEERWVHGMGDLEFDKEGNVVRMVGTVQDITEHKNMETEMMKTQKLESVGLLAAGIAHDFNNLLQGIMGNISLAKVLTNQKSKIFPLLVESEKASEQAKELSSRLLTFSKGGVPDRSTISIGSLLRGAVSLSLSGSNIACAFSLPEDLDSIEADKGQMNQVFNNLLINAKEAMPDGGTVEITASNVRMSGNANLPLKEGNYVKISVADHGTGISEKNLPRIFDPYFSTKDRGSQKGMGLGLAICHSIITKHEGHIAVESKVGAGTVFHIFLPASANKIWYEEPEKNEKLVSGKGRVLLMDDVEAVRRITSAMLRQLGYDVELAKSGEEAIKAYRRARAGGQTFDVVILDLTVQGGMGGEQALGILREIDPEVKAVASSGYADDPIMKDFRKYGFANAIAKPYKVEQLKAALSELQADYC